MRVGVFTRSLDLYARLYAALTRAGFQVEWNRQLELTLGDLDHLFARVWVWRTPLGVRAYDPLAMAFLTRQDRASSLPEGLRGRKGLGLTPGERRLLLALGRGEAWGREDRFFARRLKNKFGLPLEDLLRLARHQVQVAGLEDHLHPAPGGQAEPLLHVAGEEDLQGKGPLKPGPVGQALGV